MKALRKKFKKRKPEKNNQNFFLSQVSAPVVDTPIDLLNIIYEDTKSNRKLKEKDVPKVQIKSKEVSSVKTAEKDGSPEKENIKTQDSEESKNKTIKSKSDDLTLNPVESNKSLELTAFKKHSDFQNLVSWASSFWSKQLTTPPKPDLYAPEYNDRFGHLKDPTEGKG